jgi:hypothetical protein
LHPDLLSNRNGRITTRKRRPVSGQERQGGVTVARGADRLVMAAVLMTSATVAATVMASITLVAAAIAIGAAVIMATTVLVTTTAVTAGTAILIAITTSIVAAIAIGAAIFLASTVLVTAAAGAVMTVAVAAGAVALVIWDSGVDSLRETFVVAVPTWTAIVTAMIADGVAVAAGAVTILAIVCPSLRLVCLLLSKLHLLRLSLGGLIGDLVLNGHPDGIQGRAWLDGPEGQNQGQNRCFQ